MQKLCISLILCMIALGSKAQSLSVFGSTRDQETNRPVQSATVVLQSRTDSVFKLTTLTDTAGRFRFSGLMRDSFLIRFTSVGYDALTKSLVVDSADIDVGNIVMPKASRELTGVTVTATTPPAQQKGDTVQFNASQFKVNPDASAEDLARKMPGITVENGQVKAQGENVRRVTIDGRELFGDDATAALRNLPAEIVDKIQVFDRLSDQAQFTGFDDGNTQKEINIVTRANMRNGQFGRVYAGYGTDSRYQAGGNATLLNGNRRISLVGLVNNINQQNFSSQDLLGVTSNAQRGGGGRGGGGGQRGGGNRSNSGGNRGGGGFGSNSNFLVGQQNGINETRSGGINYADKWGSKIEVSGSYFYNKNKNRTNEAVNRQYFLKELPNDDETTSSKSDNTNHRFNLRLEYIIDSSNQIIITPRFGFQDNESERIRSNTRMFSSGQMLSEVLNNTNSQRSGNNLNNTILYRHSFPRRGRTFSININASYNKRDGETYQQTLRRAYDGATSNDSLLQQFTDQFNNGHQLSANIVLTEPIGNKGQLQLNYNPSYSKSNADQETYLYDIETQKYSLFDTTLSNQFENTYKAQNAGLSFRLGDRSRQFSAGLSYQRSELSSDQSFPRLLTVNKTFNNILPNAMLRFAFSPRSNIRLMYRANVNQPSVTQLQRVADRTNAPFITAGNPLLEQQYSHVLSARYTYTNTAKGFLLMGNVFYQASNNYITTATFVALRDTTLNFGQPLFAGEQLSQPVNLKGYSNLRSFLTLAVPIKLIRSNLNLNAAVTYGKFPGIINNVENESRNLTYTLGTVIGSNISEYVDFNISYSANFNTIKNVITPQLNNDYFSHIAGLQLNLLSKKGWFFQNDLNNQLYRGLTEGFNQSYFLWNMSAGKKLLKDQKGEVRISVFDLLRQNRSIVRNVTETYIEDESNQVLRQYFMLTFSYNLRNFGVGVSTRAGK